MCSMYPSISPWNIWDLPLEMWWAFAQSADDYTEKLRRAERDG